MVKEASNITSPTDQPDFGQIAEKYRRIREEGRRVFETETTFPCPEDGQPGYYFGDVGTYQIVVPVFKCPDDHKYSVRTIEEKKAIKLLPDQDFTPNLAEIK